MKIEGPLNASDFETLCDASFFGRLEELDLSGADIEGRKIPDKAFSHPRSPYRNPYRMTSVAKPQ